MRKRVFIYMHYLDLGGAERALVNLLKTIDPDKFEVDLFLGQQRGPLLADVPEYVRILPEIKEYASIESSIGCALRRGAYRVALGRLLAKIDYWLMSKRTPCVGGKVDDRIFQTVMLRLMPVLPDLHYLGVYDLAISFLHPHNIVLDKVRARRKVCWIHTDYSSVFIDAATEERVWGAYDNIVAISNATAEAFANLFPALSDKIAVIENIIDRASIARLSLAGDVKVGYGDNGVIRLVSVGRHCKAKRFEIIPIVARSLLDFGLKFRWTIIGPGDDTAVRANIERYCVHDVVELLGPSDNPYGHMRNCDLYVQPSLYEGHCVAVREAQVLGVPVVLSDFPTASAHVSDGVDGFVLPMAPDEFADGLYRVICNMEARGRVIEYLRTHDYTNASAVEHLYGLI